MIGLPPSAPAANATLSWPSPATTPVTSGASGVERTTIDAGADAGPAPTEFTARTSNWFVSILNDAIQAAVMGAIQAGKLPAAAVQPTPGLSTAVINTFDETQAGTMGTLAAVLFIQWALLRSRWAGWLQGLQGVARGRQDDQTAGGRRVITTYLVKKSALGL